MRSRTQAAPVAILKLTLQSANAAAEGVFRWLCRGIEGHNFGAFHQHCIDINGCGVGHGARDQPPLKWRGHGYNQARSLQKCDELQ